MTSSPSVSYGDFKFTEPEDKYFHRVQGLEFESILVSFQNKLHVSGTAVVNSAITGKGMVTAVGELLVKITSQSIGEASIKPFREKPEES